ncbi:MerR family transcriptional regulator [Microbacterium sp. No. 7]|uniref:MerR family transcriptional regulator n=1 Tax=Microbacterium sp. No. 7 TaxID=1714373 RepID=UPI0009E9D10F|nr:MerR family transcriptional regulator [Microbacterium sp. No. 7]
MLISELSQRSGVPLATVKFYLREGMLPKGRPVSATRAEYDDDHLARLRLIGALAEVRGLPLARIRDILDLVDHPDSADPVRTLGRAVEALPPYVATGGEHPLAHAAMERLGLVYHRDAAAVAQLDHALRALEAAGLDDSPATIDRYSDAMRDVAIGEIAPVADMPLSEAVSYAVLGTAMYEPLMLALRRLWHHHLVAAATAGAGDAEDATADAAASGAGETGTGEIGTGETGTADAGAAGH